MVEKSDQSARVEPGVMPCDELRVAVRDLRAIVDLLHAYDTLGANGVSVDQTLWIDAMEELNTLKTLAGE